MVSIDLATDDILYANNYIWHIHIFLTYAQCFDVVPHLNPKYSAHAGLFPESVMSMFSPKQAVCAGGVPLVEIYFSGSNHYTSTGIVVRTTKINFNKHTMGYRNRNNRDEMVVKINTNYYRCLRLVRTDDLLIHIIAPFQSVTRIYIW